MKKDVKKGKKLAKNKITQIKKKAPLKKIGDQKQNQIILQEAETGEVVQLSKAQANAFMEGLMLPRKVVLQIADEVGKAVSQRLMKRPLPDSATTTPKRSVIENPIFLDTSAIIDGRVFDLIRLGVFTGTFVVLESVLTELKNIADSKEPVKKERGRKGMKWLDEVKKMKTVGMIVLKDDLPTLQVDDRIVQSARDYKGKIVTCDYNLSKKAEITGVASIDMYQLANILKTNAIPGEIFLIKIMQKGKGEGQGVGYLPDGTMIVVEEGEGFIGSTMKVMVSRIIQTEAGKIFFSKVIESPVAEAN
jgi:uncharacterized protein YacL